MKSQPDRLTIADQSRALQQNQAGSFSTDPAGFACRFMAASFPKVDLRLGGRQAEGALRLASRL